VCITATGPARIRAETAEALLCGDTKKKHFFSTKPVYTFFFSIISFLFAFYKSSLME
jgi:hypothetical protein